MTDFFPFIHEPEKKKVEPQPLYVEEPLPVPQKRSDEDKEDEPKVVIIQL